MKIYIPTDILRYREIWDEDRRDVLLLGGPILWTQ